MRTSSLDYRGNRFPAEIIPYAVWLYHRFCLSFRDVEELLVQRGVSVSDKAMQQLDLKFGATCAKTIRR